MINFDIKFEIEYRYLESLHRLKYLIWSCRNSIKLQNKRKTILWLTITNNYYKYIRKSKLSVLWKYTIKLCSSQTPILYSHCAIQSIINCWIMSIACENEISTIVIMLLSNLFSKCHSFLLFSISIYFWMNNNYY